MRRSVFAAVSVLSVAVLASCVVWVNEVTVNRAIPPSTEYSAIGGDGVAFLVNRTCVYVVDRGANIESLAGNFREPLGVFRVQVWVVPEDAYIDEGSFVLPTEIRLTWDSGQAASPSRLVATKMYTFVEHGRGDDRIVPGTAERDPVAEGEAIGRKVKLRDTNVFALEFKKPTASSLPARITVGGVSSGSTMLPAMNVLFERVSERRLVYPGTTADGVPLSRLPASTCRKLLSETSVADRK